MSPMNAVSILQARIPGLAVVYLYGSAARGDARPDSDVDLAILADRPVASGVMDAAREAIELAVGRDVDLIDLSAAPLPLARQVLLDGIRLAEPKAALADLFEVRVLRDYSDLKDRRIGIEADIQARGAVFAR